MKSVILHIKLLLCVITLFALSCNQVQNTKEPVISSPQGSTEIAKVSVPQKVVDKNVLLGVWVRTDADYQLQISELMDDEKMKVGYFNPKSINVNKANWDTKDGRLQIYIELKDINYPGSFYKLNYIPEKDMLAGKYFQAVERVTYDVGFFRIKK